MTVVRYCHMEHQCSHFLLEKVILTPCITPFPAYNPLSAPLGICFSREKAHPSSTISNASCLLQLRLHTENPLTQELEVWQSLVPVSYDIGMGITWFGNEVTRSVGVASLCILWLSDWRWPIWRALQPLQVCPCSSEPRETCHLWVPAYQPRSRPLAEGVVRWSMVQAFPSPLH